jgi:hypothetical protein
VKPFRSFAEVDHLVPKKPDSRSAASTGANNIHRNAANNIVLTANFMTALLSNTVFCFEPVCRRTEMTERTRQVHDTHGRSRRDILKPRA